MKEAAEKERRLGWKSVLELAGERGDGPLWLDDRGGVTWKDFGARVEERRARCVAAGVRQGDVVVAPGEAALESLEWLFALSSVGAVAAPLRRERLGELAVWRGHLRLNWAVKDDGLVAMDEGAVTVRASELLGQLRQRGHAGLILATSGTTGTAKLILHDLDNLLGAIPVRTARGWRTLPLMRFDHVGGLDMAFRALGSGQVLVAPPGELSPEAVAEVVARQRVEVMPATPSFLNLLLLSGASACHDLRTLRLVPYGAEPMPAGLLERLKAAFPATDFVERFGTSETGALPVRSAGDGLQLKEGTGFSWKIVDGVLWVKSPVQGLGYLSCPGGSIDDRGWFCTGDLAEIGPGGSVKVLGRREEMINVGGEKVLPSAVESVMSGHPLVADCRALAIPNAVLGQVVGLEVVWRGSDRDAVTIKRSLHAFAARSLPRFHLPAVVRPVGSIETGPNLKKQRGPRP